VSVGISLFFSILLVILVMISASTRHTNEILSSMDVVPVVEDLILLCLHPESL
jgi:hypothetical protein